MRNILLAALAAAPMLLHAQAAAVQPAAEAAANDKAPQKVTVSLPDWFPAVSGTIRAKAEYQMNEDEARFQVRNARVALGGNITPIVEYKAEIDLSDQGQIKMLDAYAGVLPVKGLDLRLGQMRVPFTIDAHRSPHVQYFANRSFIAKQVGNVRDVGFYAGYKVSGFPLIIEGGLFNGSGLTNQNNYWTRGFNFSGKVQIPLACGLTLEGSVQKVSPNRRSVYLYDGGVTLKSGRFTVEAEYLRKHYTDGVFTAVNAFDGFVCYDQPMRKVFEKVSFLGRFDCMDDHSDGTLDDQGRWKLTDGARKRITGGITFSFTKKLNADLRLNYEKYFYDNIALAKPSERDKTVVELMIHFPYKKK